MPTTQLTPPVCNASAHPASLPVTYPPRRSKLVYRITTQKCFGNLYGKHCGKPCGKLCGKFSIVSYKETQIFRTEFFHKIFHKVFHKVFHEVFHIVFFTWFFTGVFRWFFTLFFMRLLTVLFSLSFGGVLSPCFLISFVLHFDSVFTHMLFTIKVLLAQGHNAQGSTLIVDFVLIVVL